MLRNRRRPASRLVRATVSVTLPALLERSSQSVMKSTTTHETPCYTSRLSRSLRKKLSGRDVFHCRKVRTGILASYARKRARLTRIVSPDNVHMNSERANWRAYRTTCPVKA